MINRRAILVLTTLALLAMSSCLPQSQHDPAQQHINTGTATQQPIAPPATTPPNTISLPTSTATTIPPATPSATIILEDESVTAAPELIEETPLSMDTHNPSSTKSATEQWIALARQDLAQRLDINENGIQLLEAKSVTWPDASLGCPQPGMAYAQSPAEGQLIRLNAEGWMYFYHSGDTQEPFLCQETFQIVPKSTPKFDGMIPPPGSEID